MQASLRVAISITCVNRWYAALADLARELPGAWARILRENGVMSLIKRMVGGILPDWLLQPVKKLHYARLLRSFSAEDEPDIKLVKYLAEPGSAVLDIGANVGVYAKFSSQFVGPGGRVYSIEPVPVTCDVLRSNVKKLHLGNVDVINAAISDSNGSVTMEVPCYESGVENFYEAHIVTRGDSADSNLRQVTVECRTLDSMFSGLSHEISLIKCDVEGHEFRVIKGASEIVAASMPAWLIEISGSPDEHGTNANNTFNLMRGLGYGAYWFDRAEIKKRLTGERSTNYFFLTHEHLRSLAASDVPGAARILRDDARKLRASSYVADDTVRPVEMVA